ncbi:hypothetical protein [Devosia submarina]|uniref:hypothetical protein n=1 Tax=Devosia submarina TaxID=1173082 RepID=UPI000D369F67|nr:hypothetical protein [Devosia submarina]
MSDSADDITALLKRLAAGPSPARLEQPKRIPKPISSLSIDDPDERSIILIIRTSGDGVIRGMISLPAWHELPEFWEGPYDVGDALKLADDYAWEYGYRGIAIDIESSQLWDPSWGVLEVSGAE